MNSVRTMTMLLRLRQHACVGDGTYSPSSASTTLDVGVEAIATATNLTVTPTMPVATQPASFAVTLNSSGTGTPALAGETITITYGDGSTDRGTTDANGAVTFTHTYAIFGSKNGRRLRG